MKRPLAHSLIIASNSNSIHCPMKHSMRELALEKEVPVCDQPSDTNESSYHEAQAERFPMHWLRVSICACVSLLDSECVCVCVGRGVKSEGYQSMMPKLSESLHKWIRDSIYMRKWGDQLSVLHHCLWAVTHTDAHTHTAEKHKRLQKKPPN